MRPPPTRFAGVFRAASPCLPHRLRDPARPFPFLRFDRPAFGGRFRCVFARLLIAEARRFFTLPRLFIEAGQALDEVLPPLDIGHGEPVF